MMPKHMEEHRKHIMEVFQQHLANSFGEHCLKHEDTPAVEAFITFLIDRHLLTPVTIRRYAIRVEFDRLYAQRVYRKTQIVELLADRFNVSPRYIWSLVQMTKEKD
ncbi:MAG: hypothetical protein AAGD05_15815 [Bacteroidota bacterium]